MRQLCRDLESMVPLPWGSGRRCAGGAALEPAQVSASCKATRSANALQVEVLRHAAQEPGLLWLAGCFYSRVSRRPITGLRVAHKGGGGVND